MRDTELYRHLLGLVTPWEVERVDLSVEDGRVDVWVKHPKRTRFACPDCERELSVYDHSEERAWRHLDSCAFLTFLHANPPRVSCPEHGVRQVRVPWAEPHSRFTLLFERLAIDVLSACDVNAAAGLLRLSWDQAWHMMDRAVARGLAAKPLTAPTHAGVAEKAAGRGQGRVHRRRTPTGQSVRLLRPVHDRTAGRHRGGRDGHVGAVRELGARAPGRCRGQDRLRPLPPDGLPDQGRGHRTQAGEPGLGRGGDKSLAGSKYLWLYSHENLPAPHQDRFNALRAADLKTGRAWAIKESLRHFWSYKRRGWGAKHFKRWYFWATHSRLKPIIEAAKTLKRHEAG